MTFGTIARLRSDFTNSSLHHLNYLSMSSFKLINGYSSATGKDLETSWHLKMCASRNKEETPFTVQSFAARRSSRQLFRLLQGSGESGMGGLVSRITEEPLTQ